MIDKIKIKDDKIDNLEKKIDTIMKTNEETKKMNEELKQQNLRLEKMMAKADIKLDKTLDELYEAKEDREKICEQLNETNEQLESTNDKLDYSETILKKVSKKLDIAVDDRVIKTKSITTHEYFVLLKNEKEKYKYYAIRGQKRYVENKVNEKKDDNYIHVKTIECIPNSTNLWLRLKEQLKGSDEYCGNKMNLVNLKEKEFVKKIEEIHNQRKSIKLVDQAI
jgi:hypothetical protein